MTDRVMRVPGRRQFARVAAVLGTSLTSCAGQGTAQPGSGTSDATATADAEGGSSLDARTGSDASTSGGDAPSGPYPDASGDRGTVEPADSGADAAGESGAPGWTCPSGPFASPIPSGATPARVAGLPPSDAFNNNNNNFGIIEGPVWIGDALYVSEIGSGPNPPPSRILRVTTAGTVTVAIADSGSNGLAVDKNGNLHGAVHKDGSVSRFDLSSGTATAIASNYMGKRFDSPNDLAIRSDGNIYFSDPDYQAPSPAPQSQTRLYRIAAGTNSVTVIDATLSEPNGVTLSLDENTLYVTSNNGIYEYPVMGDGTVGSGTVFAQSVNGDGMSLDCAGNLYVAVTSSSNVVVLSPTGTQLGQLSVPAGMVQSVTNTAFGGPEHKTLYITALGSGAQKSLFEVALAIPGMPY
jgi:gluconolactonase